MNSLSPDLLGEILNHVWKGSAELSKSWLVGKCRTLCGKDLPNSLSTDLWGNTEPFVERVWRQVACKLHSSQTKLLLFRLYCALCGLKITRFSVRFLLHARNQSLSTNLASCPGGQLVHRNSFYRRRESQRQSVKPNAVFCGAIFSGGETGPEN